MIKLIKSSPNKYLVNQLIILKIFKKMFLKPISDLLIYTYREYVKANLNEKCSNVIIYLNY